MALSPELEIDESLSSDDFEIKTVRTYCINFDTGRITNTIIGGLEAIEQFVHIALRTSRYTHRIYSNDYGSEIKALLSDKDVSTDFKLSDLPRLIREALIYDERIEDITNLEISHVNDAFIVRFTVVSVEGVLEIEEVLV